MLYCIYFNVGHRRERVRARRSHSRACAKHFPRLNDSPDLGDGEYVCVQVCVWVWCKMGDECAAAGGVYNIYLATYVCTLNHRMLPT